MSKKKSVTDLNRSKIAKEIRESFEKLTPEEVEKYFPKSTTPKGWVSIEDELPSWKAMDLMQGYTIYKVKDKDGKIFKSGVTDHDCWYYAAQDAGITHWWNE